MEPMVVVCEYHEYGTESLRTIQYAEEDRLDVVFVDAK